MLPVVQQEALLVCMPLCEILAAACAAPFRHICLDRNLKRRVGKQRVKLAVP